MKNQRNTIIAFAKWLGKKYIELEKEVLPNTCKIAKIINHGVDQYVLVQFSGQSHTIEIDPKKIIELNLFEYFSSEDKKLLFSMVYNHYQLKLSDQYYCKNTNREMISLTDMLTKNKLTIPAETVSVNSEIIDKINSHDAIRIGFLAGMDYLKSLHKKTKAD